MRDKNKILTADTTWLDALLGFQTNSPNSGLPTPIALESPQSVVSQVLGTSLVAPSFEVGGVSLANISPTLNKMAQLVFNAFPGIGRERVFDIMIRCACSTSGFLTVGGSKSVVADNYARSLRGGKFQPDLTEGCTLSLGEYPLVVKGTEIETNEVIAAGSGNGTIIMTHTQHAFRPPVTGKRRTKDMVKEAHDAVAMAASRETSLSEAHAESTAMAPLSKVKLGSNRLSNKLGSLSLL